MFVCCPPSVGKDNPWCRLTRRRRSRGNPGTNWIRQIRGPDQICRFIHWAFRKSTRCRAVGHVQLKSIRLDLAALKEGTVGGSKQSMLSKRVRENFGLVIGRRLYKTRWRRLLTWTSLSLTVLRQNYAAQAFLLSCHAFPTLHPDSL